MQVEPLLRPHDLALPPEYQPDFRFNTERIWWHVPCTVTAYAEHDRFDPEPEDFRLVLSIEMTIYHDEADAVRFYDQMVTAAVTRPAERYPDNTTTGEPTGWWDDGVSLTLIEELDPADSTIYDIVILRLDNRLVIRHSNLMAIVTLQAQSLPEDATEVTRLLQDLTPAFLDEAVAHLTRTG